jgi:hypothetical protein
VIAYFNYINRIADGLHVEQGEFIRPWEESPYPDPDYQSAPMGVRNEVS